MQRAGGAAATDVVAVESGSAPRRKAGGEHHPERRRPGGAVCRDVSAASPANGSPRRTAVHPWPRLLSRFDVAESQAGHQRIAKFSRRATADARSPAATPALPTTTVHRDVRLALPAGSVCGTSGSSPSPSRRRRVPCRRRSRRAGQLYTSPEGCQSPPSPVHRDPAVGWLQRAGAVPDPNGQNASRRRPWQYHEQRERCFRGSMVTRLRLVGAMHPCPCGYFGDPRQSCTCAPSAVSRSQTK